MVVELTELNEALEEFDLRIYNRTIKVTGEKPLTTHARESTVVRALKVYISDMKQKMRNVLLELFIKSKR